MLLAMRRASFWRPDCGLPTGSGSAISVRLGLLALFLVDLVRGRPSGCVPCDGGKGGATSEDNPFGRRGPAKDTFSDGIMDALVQCYQQMFGEMPGVERPNPMNAATTNAVARKWSGYRRLCGLPIAASQTTSWRNQMP